MAGGVPDAAHRLADRPEPRFGGAGPGLTEPGYAHKDDARVRRTQRRVVETPSFQRAGPKVLHHHIALLREASHEVATAFVAKVDRDRSLVARDRRPPEAASV